MFNNSKFSGRYRQWNADQNIAFRLAELRRRQDRTRLTIEAWLEMILILASGALAYAILVGPR